MTTLANTRPVAAVLALVFGLLALGILLAAALGLGRLAHRGWIPWRVTARRAGWMPPIASAALVAAVLALLPLSLALRPTLMEAVIAVVPVVFAMQVPLLVSPEGEPGLEVLLACRRPFYWLAVERVALALAGQAAAAGLALALAYVWQSEHDLLAGMAAWLAPAFMLGGLGALVAVRTRQPLLGATFGLLAWCAFVVSSRLFLPPASAAELWPRPLDALQPYLWMVHPFMRSEALTRSDLALNRAIVSGVGLGLVAWAVVLLRDSERILLGGNRN